MKRLFAFYLATMASIMSHGDLCCAADVFFNGSVSEDWHDGNNWSDGFEPELASDGYFVQDELTAVYSTGMSSIPKLVVGDSSPGTFKMTGGELSIEDGGDSFQIGRGCCDGGGLVELTGDAILRTTENSGVGERDEGILRIGPDAAVISPNAYWRVGNFGPSVDAGLQGNGLIEVEGMFNTRSIFIGVQDGTGTLRVSGNGAVTLTPFADGDPLSADINMNFNHDPTNHPNQSGTIHMVGSNASISARTLQSQHDAASPIKNQLWFTADAEGVSPITLAEEVNITNNKLTVDLTEADFEQLSSFLLVDAAPGKVVGEFAELEVIGENTANYSFSVLYDQTEGDIVLMSSLLCADGFGCTRSDIDQSGKVDFADFLSLSGKFGNDVGAEERADIDRSGQVNFADFLILSSDFGKTASLPAAASVPEPSSLALLAIGGVALMRFRKFSKSERK